MASPSWVATIHLSAFCKLSAYLSKIEDRKFHLPRNGQCILPLVEIYEFMRVSEEYRPGDPT